MKKTVLITGSSRGIGAACALEFASRGFNVAINYSSSEKQALEVLEKVRKTGALSIAVKANVSEMKDAEKLVNKTLEEFGRIDVLVNNAGIASQKLFTDFSEDEWKKIFAVNVFGMFNCTKHAAKQMIKNHSGKIVNISSVWGMSGASCETVYSSSKAAVIGFTKALAKELGPCGVQVNCVAPGVIDTAMNSHLNDEDIVRLKYDTPCERIGTPEEIAKAVLFLASSDSDFITGQVLSPNGGFLT